MNEKDTVREGKNKKSPAQSTQLYMRIAEIRDNAVVLKNGGLRGIFRVTAVNFNLKSEQEQNALIYGYQSFLNTLEFPVQITVRSRKLDIDKYIEQLKGIGEKQTNPLLQKQTFEYTDFIARLVEYADIMEKEFLVVVPYNPGRAQEAGMFARLLSHLQPKDTYGEVKRRHEEFEQLKKSLSQRMSTIQNGLESMGLKTTELSTQELIELFYEIYNPITSRNQKIEKIEEMAIEKDQTSV
ncbi:MAG: hypothetical protein AAB551_04795 [Patescibacteria group bacterium]